MKNLFKNLLFVLLFAGMLFIIGCDEDLPPVTDASQPTVSAEVTNITNTSFNVEYTLKDESATVSSLKVVVTTNNQTVKDTVIPNNGSVVVNDLDSINTYKVVIKANYKEAYKVFEFNEELYTSNVTLIDVDKEDFTKDDIAVDTLRSAYTGEAIAFTYEVPTGVTHSVKYYFNNEEISQILAIGVYKVVISLGATATHNATTLEYTFTVTDSSTADLYISEYLDGDKTTTGNGNDHAIVLTNPTASEVDLSGYTMEIYQSASLEPNITIALSGKVAANGKFVIINENSSGFLTEIGDMTGQLWFSGKHVIVIKNGEEIIDIIGVIGVDYTSWDTVGDTPSAFINHHVIRTVLQGNPEFDASEWEVVDDYENFGK